MDVELTKVSQKGQVVIPREIREKLGIKKGTRFAVYGSEDTIIFRKIDMPDLREFKDLTKKTARKISPEEIEKEIRETRKDAQSSPGHKHSGVRIHDPQGKRMAGDKEDS